MADGCLGGTSDGLVGILLGFHTHFTWAFTKHQHAGRLSLWYIDRVILLSYHRTKSGGPYMWKDTESFETTVPSPSPGFSVFTRSLPSLLHRLENARALDPNHRSVDRMRIGPISQVPANQCKSGPTPQVRSHTQR